MTRLRRGERGVGLIEVLISVLLLSVGLLAAARMQVQSLRSSQAAYHRSQAWFMATDMVDRMRANFAGALAGAYDGASTSDAASDPGCGARACDSTAIAEQDVREWSARLYPLGREGEFMPLLPSVESIDAAGVVERVDEGVYRVTVSWAEPDGFGHRRASLAMDFATEVRE